MSLPMDAKLPVSNPHALASLACEFDLALMILYGSMPTGRVHPDSDTDIGVLGSKGALPTRKFLDLDSRLNQALGPGELDLVDLRRVPGLLRHAAAEKAIILYEAEPGVFAKFRVLAWNLYQDERISIRRHDSAAIRIALESFC